MVYNIDSGIKIGNSINNFKYNISSKEYNFPVDPLIVKKDLITVASIVGEKSIDVETIIKINLLQQLQVQGMLEMDIVKLVKDGRDKEIDKICTNCMEYFDKWGFKVVKKTDTKTNRILRVWDFGREQ